MNFSVGENSIWLSRFIVQFMKLKNIFRFEFGILLCFTAFNYAILVSLKT